MSLAILFHFLCAQHVLDIIIAIIRSLRLFCWITTLVVLFLARSVSEFRCGWVEVVSVLQASACYVYWTMHHCDSWRIKDQLDVTCCFISLLLFSTCFGHYYIHHQELATFLLNYHIGRVVLGSMCVAVSVWLGWSGIRVAVVLQPATRIPLQPNHTETPTHIEPRTIQPMW